MKKLQKQYYYSSDGIKKINCYKLNIPKILINQAGFQDNDEINIRVEDNKIIIEKK